jgi:hypothetical protein
MRIDELVSEYRHLFPEFFSTRKSGQNRANKGTIGAGGGGHGRSMMGGSVLGSVVMAPGTLPGSGAPASIVQQKILSFKLPSAVDDDVDAGVEDGENGRPLTREELRTRTMLAMQRNQEKMRMRRSSSKMK